MKKFEEKKFDIPKLKGISEKNIEEHLKLYAGYVKNINLILEQENVKLGFEFDGMRNHEYYFSAFEGGQAPLTAGDSIYREIENTWGSFDRWLARFKFIAIFAISY